MSEEISNVHILALQEQIRKNLAFRDNLLREKSVDDLWVFNRYILDVERGKKPLGQFQKQLCRFIEEEKTVKKLGLLPRGHLKTTLATIGYSTQQIVKNQNIRILLLNGTWQLAVDSLAEVKRHLQTNPNILRIWGDLTVGNSEWSQDRITLARSNTNIKGPTVWAAGIESNLIGSHPDIIIMDDVVTRENTETIEQIDKVKLRYKDALDLLEPGGQLIIIGCLTRESKVLMGNGSWKEIDQVKAGDIVFSHKDKKLVKRKVEALIPQGKARVFSVKTARHQIKATDRHPFLTINAENETHWKRVQQLQAGEKVLTIAQVPIETSKRFYDGSFLRKEDFYLLGYLWGDGWLTNNKPKGIVGFCVAKGVNDTFLPILKKWAPNYKETAYGYYRIQNTKIGKWLQKNGFSSGAKIKRIPQWIFEARTSYRKAFIDGLLAADGCKQKKGYEERIELANKGLIEDLYWLSLTSGYRPTTIFHRQRMIQAPHSKEESLHDFWSLGLVVSHHQSWGENQYTWRWDRITSIQEEGEEEVFDLTIEETANFIANGYVVHNTRYTYNDFYSWIIEKNEKHNNFRMMIKRAFIGDMHTGQEFQALWPEKFSREELLERLQEKGPYEFFCTPSETPILMGDYTEKRISRVKPGDEIIGFTTGASERHRLVKTKVTRRMYYPNVEIYQIKLKSGRFVRCTLDHKWYSGRGSLDKTHPMYYKPKIGRTLGFVAPIDDIMPTQKELRAWNYLAGIFDGEGSAKSGGCLTISQGNGNMPVYKKIIEILQYLKIDYSESERLPDYANGRNNQGGKLIWLRDNFETQLKLIRYTELAKKQQLIDRLLEKGRRFIREEDVIVSIELLRKDNVYALETETGNYIAWGYASSNSQYCNEPTSAEDADFKREWFKYYDPEEYRGAKMNTVMTIDPAISEKKSADYTAIGVFAADQWQNHFVKDLYRGHWKVDKIVEAIFYVYALHHPQAIILETIAYQKALAYILQLEMQKRGIYLPIIEKQYHDRSKDERIRALQPLYAAGKVFHQKAISLTRNFEEELLQFPRGAHDDLIDTFAMSLDYLVPPTRHHAKRYQQKYLY